jgi:hypothetical protein
MHGPPRIPFPSWASRTAVKPYESELGVLASARCCVGLCFLFCLMYFGPDGSCGLF